MLHKHRVDRQICDPTQLAEKRSEYYLVSEEGRGTVIPEEAPDTEH